jgi:hypothetical protein
MGVRDKVAGRGCGLVVGYPGVEILLGSSKSRSCTAAAAGISCDGWAVLHCWAANLNEMLELVLLEEQVLGFNPVRRSTVVNELGVSLLTANGDATKLGTQPQRGGPRGRWEMSSKDLERTV